DGGRGADPRPRCPAAAGDRPSHPPRRGSHDLRRARHRPDPRRSPEIPHRLDHVTGWRSERSDPRRAQTPPSSSGAGPPPPAPAAVLHEALPTNRLTLIVSAGRRQGVKPLAAVVSPEGLVGIVSTVDAQTSVVVTWAHPEFRASAMAADGSVYGIVAPHGTEGPRTWLLELRGVPYRQLVPNGTVILTSGLGGVFPRGIPLGTVVGVAGAATGWERTYLVRPAVHPSAVSHVMILTGGRSGTPGDLRGVFERGEQGP